MSISFNIKKKDINSKKKCILCKSQNLKKISEIFYKNSFIFFSTSLCKKCGFVFRDKHPSNNWFKKQYNLRSKFQFNKNLGINKSYEKFRLERYKKLLEFLEKKINFKSVIDIGCATGIGLKIFEKKNYNTLGIDTDKTRINYGKKNNLNLIHSDIFKFSKKNKFDLILCLHTLEHFTDPNRAIKKITKFMKSNSYIYIEVPDFKNLVRTWDDSVYLAHISNFSEKNLIYFLKQNNLKPLYRTYPQTENGEVNLGILCKKHTYSKIFQDFKIPHIKSYKLIGNKNKLNIPYKINLDLINDISFSFKVKGNKGNSLDTNFKRKLIFNKLNNKYEISKDVVYFRIKKLKFFKNIKYKKII